jgi:hypothetical protein
MLTMPLNLARINKLLQTLDPVSRRTENKHQIVINKTLHMQIRINNLEQTLQNLEKSYDDAFKNSQTMEILLNSKLSQSERSIRDQLDNNMKQK